MIESNRANVIELNKHEPSLGTFIRLKSEGAPLRLQEPSIFGSSSRIRFSSLKATIWSKSSMLMIFGGKPFFNLRASAIG